MTPTTPIQTNPNPKIEISDLMWVYLRQHQTRADNTFNKILMKLLNLKEVNSRLIKIADRK